jgi:alanine dehydrogenase
LREDPHLRAGLNIHDGKVTCEPVAAAHGLPYTPPESVL